MLSFMLTNKHHFNTRYLVGDKFHYIGDELDGLEILERDAKGLEILKREGNKIRTKTVVNIYWDRNGNRNGYLIVTTDYKKAVK